MKHDHAGQGHAHEAQRRRTMVTAGVVERLGGAVLLAAAMWLAVWWALAGPSS